MLDKLKKVELRAGWKHEAHDFTNWMAQEENLNLLGDEIGFDISLIQTEAKVGSFNVDILAEEANTGNKIIIENQLENTDHDHLGKILTYASGYDAQVIIWVVKNAREEHRQAIDWLNENTNENIGFYLLKIELWQIGTSLPAPKFEIISRPNDWVKTVKSSTGSSEFTDTKIKQLEFWNLFKDFAKQNNTTLRFQKSYPQHWTIISIGNSDCHISLTINSRENLYGCEIYIPNNKDLYQKFFEQKQEIEAELDMGLEWMELSEKKASRIKTSIIGDFEDESSWEDIFEWMKITGEKFKRVFPRYIK
ncbi:DUF4268 domain-containing protein [Patescibacteria group bacterium]|nr:DUF4268 domain-containing protein [Patescibacteria group bacterium]